ncbi:aminoglycoside phosphotransferase family protein [Paenibacillus tritici]|uniref:Aminoglycoside phosphotransferase family protein n=1 Tax=Paenibacillus tritici TaxID=1873425 RepID=A0ABX2DVR2_9BACL|nr:aminoglycoside phosphotransferase family protein [Paenibacillus tritici]NQX48789.1 aminoglycoside phosphotransferase family protein [Paenibacillus tritici]
MQGKVIGEGRTAEVLEYAEGTILKLYKDEVPESHVDLEYRISRLVHAQGVNTPQPHERVMEGERHGIVYQQIPGPSLLKLMDGKPWLILSCLRQMAALHYSLHQLEGVGEAGEQKQRLEHNIIAAPMLETGEKSQILSHLARLPDGKKLCHGDFHPDNILMDDKLWVIDWMTAVTGNPAADVARSVIMFRIGAMPERASLFTKAFIGFARQRMTAQYIRKYLKCSGLTRADIEPWILPVAAARLVEGLSIPEKELLVREIRKRLRALPREQ